ncbi:MAG: hypothetical protein GYB31_12235 [Bacteroidetes bacterium]|nr:hypothetical protein [Bacteroidota bacterium]
MKKPLLYFLVLLSSFPMLAQETGVHFCLRADYERSKMTGSDLNDFFNSYNAYYAGVIPQEFDTLSPHEFSHPAFGAGLRFLMGEGNIGFSSGLLGTYGYAKRTRNAVFQNDIETELAMRVRDLNIQFEVGMYFFQRVFIHGHITGRFRKTVADLGYYYQDGSYSLGDEYDILGVYSGLTTTVDLGGSVGLKLGPVYIPVSVSFPTQFASDDGLLTLIDYDVRQIRWTDLPRDYGQWVDDPVNMDPFNDFVRMNSLQSFRINIAVEYWF